jgi:NADP-reducing hydrogenase subunit HndB
MAKIKSFEELKMIREKVQSKVELREKGENVDSLVQVKVALATCGIAAGMIQNTWAFIKNNYV